MVRLKKILSWLWPQRVATTKGTISPVLEVSYENGRLVLNAGEVNYSYGALHDVFRIALQHAKIETLQPSRVLILGFGAGSIASILIEENQLSPEITGVEADSEVIRIATTFFSATRFPGLKLVHARAEDFVASAAGPYDLIAVDVFVESKVPESCREENFLRKLYALLAPGGCVVFNVMPGSKEEKDEFATRFMRVFPSAAVHDIVFYGEGNRVFIGYKTGV